MDRQNKFFSGATIKILLAILATSSPFYASAQSDNASEVKKIIPAITDLLFSNSSNTLENNGYQTNLALIKASSVRNTNHDGSIYANTPSNDLVLADHYGPRSDYLGFPGGNPEQSFPIVAGEQNRAACEFSHFAYDDPLLFPNQPGASHLHMFFGNTDVNAYSTYETLIDSGSSTCNGQELNRTGYWVPALFDDTGNVRIPERIVVYYKGDGGTNASNEAIPYPEGAAMIASIDINTLPSANGGAEGQYSFKCSDQYSGDDLPAGVTMPACDGSRYLESNVTENTNKYTVLEMNVKFPQCWNREDPSDIGNWSIPRFGSWFGSFCQEKATLPNLEYFVNYRVEVGENTEDWFLSSDVNMQTGEITVEKGSSVHGDWWGGWNKQVNQLWIDNCVNFSIDGEASGCGFGYLTNGGADNQNPLPGPALKVRPQYTGPSSVASETLFNELCRTTRTFTKSEDAAYCTPRMAGG